VVAAIQGGGRTPDGGRALAAAVGEKFTAANYRFSLTVSWARHHHLLPAGNLNGRESSMPTASRHVPISLRRMLRVLPVLAASALLAVFLPAASAAGASGPSFVALGDSYTSGAFIPHQTGNPAGCLRSTRSYPSLVAAALGTVSFTDASCAGATTAEMTAQQPVAGGVNPPEVNALSAGTTLVTLGVGGNDIGFTSIIITCSGLSYSRPNGSPCENFYTVGGTDRLAEMISATGPKVAAVLAAIHQRAPQARVLLVGYPDILPAAGQGCWPAAPIARGDVLYLRGVELELNAMLAAEAAANNATYVDTYGGSIGHDFCQPTGVKWVEGLVPTSPAAPVHPNALGEQAMAQQVLAAVG
jgi:lysophospholipase L1-like esterase